MKESIDRKCLQNEIQTVTYKEYTLDTCIDKSWKEKLGTKL